MQSIIMQVNEYSVAVADDIADFGADLWPRGSRPSTVYAAYEWLESQQGWNTPRCVYLLLRRTEDGEVVAALSCYVAEDPDQVRFDNCPRMLLNVDHPRDLADALPDGDAERLRTVAGQLRDEYALPYPALVATAGNAAMFGFAEAGVKADEQPAILEALLESVDMVADHLGIPTRAVWYNRPDDFPQIRPLLEARGYAGTLINADSRLDIAWASLDEYIAWLPRTRRYDVKREIRAFEEAGYSVQVRGAEALDAQLCQLYADLQQRFGHPADAAAIERGFQHVAERLGDKMRVFTAVHGDEVLGFVLALEHEGVLFTRQAGFRRAEGSSSRFVYFNTLFYAMIRYAIDHGVDAIEYGTESFGAKLQRGCRLRTIEAFVRSTGTDPARLSAYFDHYAAAATAYMVGHGAPISALNR